MPTFWRPKILISFTTIPSRFEHVPSAVSNLLKQQTWANFEVVVSIPRAYKRFPDWDGQIPAELHSLGDKVRLHRPEVDYGMC